MAIASANQQAHGQAKAHKTGTTSSTRKVEEHVKELIVPTGIAHGLCGIMCRATSFLAGLLSCRQFK